jgi:hypothetical protein
MKSEDTMTAEEKQRIRSLAFDAYRDMFAEMSTDARACWFLISDESELLSFMVGKDETVAQASERHAIKLTAMADALESLPCAEVERKTIEDLRRLASAHHDS